MWNRDPLVSIIDWKKDSYFLIFLYRYNSFAYTYLVGYSWFHEDGSFSVHSISIPKCTGTMPFRFLYRSANICISLSRSLVSAEIYISCSVHKYKWHCSCGKRFYKTYISQIQDPNKPTVVCINGTKSILIIDNRFI